MATRRELIRAGTSAALGAMTLPVANPLAASHLTGATPSTQRIRFGVSTYSYWHFTKEKYPIEKVIEHAAQVGFEGVEVLHRQMAEEGKPYLNRLKRVAWDNGISLFFLSIHQNFVQPDKVKRREHIDHTKRCLDLAAYLGCPAIRLNSGRWGTIPEFQKMLDAGGQEKPIEGYTDDDAFNWCIESINECLPHAESVGVALALENHWGLTTSVDGLLRIYKAVNSPWLVLNVDTGNFFGDPYPQLERLAPAREHCPGQDVLRRRGLLHASARFQTHRQDSTHCRIQGLGLARNGRQRGRDDSSAKKLQGIERSVQPMTEKVLSAGC